MTDLKYNRTTELSTKTLGKLSAYFDVSLDFLLGNEEKNPATKNDSEISKIQLEFIEKVKQMSDADLERLARILDIVESKGQ